MTAPAPLLFALEESRPLAEDLARRTGVIFAPLEERRFEVGEFKLRPLVSVRDRTVLVVESLAGDDTHSASDRLVRMLFLTLGLRDAGASRLILVVPYLTFARKDRRTQVRDPVSSRYVAQLIEATCPDRLIALDVHNPAAFDNAFRIATDHLSALPLFTHHFADRLPPDARLAIASPDVGGIKRAQLFREQLERRLTRDVELVFLEKRRARGAVSGGLVCGEVRDRSVIVIDDLCASGGTLMRAAGALRRAGAGEVHAAFTHAPCAAGLSAVAACPDISTVTLTDSVDTKLSEVSPALLARVTVLAIAPLLAEAITRLLTSRPVTPLLERFPPDDGSA